ncbi:MAG: hypothetical protein ACTMIA_06560 [Vibrio sp.]
MAISGIGSNGYDIIQRSQQMADNAAQAIQQSQVQDQRNDPMAFNKVDLSEQGKVQAEQSIKDERVPSQTDSLVQLNQAQNYNRAGVSVVQKERDMLGSMLDLRV